LSSISAKIGQIRLFSRFEEPVLEVQFFILTGGALTDFRMPYWFGAVGFWGGSFPSYKKARLAKPAELVLD